MLFNYKYFKEIYFAFLLLFLVVLSGATGFMVIEGYSLSEAIYMTIITVSTVGFHEVHPLSASGRLFTAILIISSFGIFAYAATSITSYLVTGKYKKYFIDFKVDKEIKNIKNHVILCGFGRNGKQAIKKLSLHGIPIVVIENRDDEIDYLRNEGIIYINGNATDEENIKKAGVLKANALISTLPSDSDNVFVVLTARDLNSDLTIISRASDATSVRKLKIAGADNVIMPETLGGDHMASLVSTPDIMEFLDQISISGSSSSNLEEVNIENLPKRLKGNSVSEIEKSFSTGVKIIGLKTKDGGYLVNPEKSTVLDDGAKLIVLGTKIQIHQLNKVLENV